MPCTTERSVLPIAVGEVLLFPLYQLFSAIIVNRFNKQSSTHSCSFSIPSRTEHSHSITKLELRSIRLRLLNANKWEKKQLKVSAHAKWFEINEVWLQSSSQTAYSWVEKLVVNARLNQKAANYVRWRMLVTVLMKTLSACNNNNCLLGQPGESAAELSETLTQYTTFIVLKFFTGTLNLPSQSSLQDVVLRKTKNSWKKHEEPRTDSTVPLHSPDSGFDEVLG